MLAMSQGSRELFHSDLLAWYLNRFPAFREALLHEWNVAPGPGPGAGVDHVRREWHHLDLVMHAPDRQALVVENKMFALPDEAQLDSYAGTVAEHLPGTPSLVLLSLTDPGWPGGLWGRPPAQWTYRSYRELMGLLRQMRPQVSAEDEFAGMVLERWTRMLARLHELADAVGQPLLDEPLELDAATRRELKRMHAPVQKMRCQFVAASVRRILLQEIPGIDVRAGLSNAAGFVQGFVDGPGCRLGWQLQGRQFRLAFITTEDAGRGRTDKERQARYALARRHADFFDFETVRKVFAGAGPEQPVHVDGEPLGFRRFDPDFAYRYVDVGGISAGQAIELGVHYGRAAAGRTAGVKGSGGAVDDGLEEG
jgi:hypothetical protein